MVIIFSGRKNLIEKEIIEILTKHNATYISDKKVSEGYGSLTIVSQYKTADINLKEGIVIILDNSTRFEDQKIPKGIIGICEDTNTKAIDIFQKNDIPVISCGMGSKNTITVSSFNVSVLLVTLQRTITDKSGNMIYPGEFKVNLTKKYSPFSVMASTAVLLLNGIHPELY